MNHPVSRRSLLAGAGAAALALPFLGRVPSAFAAPERKLVIFFTPNEWVDRDHWAMGSEGQSIALSGALPTILAPLELHRDKICLVGDLAYPTSPTGTRNSGHMGSGMLLTGTENQFWGASEEDFWAGGVSIDQFLAERFGEQPLLLGALPDISNMKNNGKTRISYTSANNPVAPEADPREAFDDLFGLASLPVAEQDAIRARQKLVLDTTAASLLRVKGRLPTEDALKLEQHLDHVTALRAELDAPVTACSPGDGPPATLNPDSVADYPLIIDSHVDVAVQALACGLHRVAVIQCNNTTGNSLHPKEFGLPVSEGSHDLSHAYNQDHSDPTIRAERELLETFYTERFAHLLDKLDTTPDVSGTTLLDNTLVVYVKAFGFGHRSEQMLAILAGANGADGAVPLGHFHSAGGASHNDLLTLLCHLFGADDIDVFGDPLLGSGALQIG